MADRLIRSLEGLDQDWQSLVVDLHDYSNEDRAYILKHVLEAYCIDCGRARTPGITCDCKKHPLDRDRNEPSETVDFTLCDGCDRRVLWAHHERTKKTAPLVLPRDGEKPNIAVKLFGGYSDSSAASGETLVWQYRILKKGETAPVDGESSQLFLNHFANCKSAAKFKRP